MKYLLFWDLFFSHIKSISEDEVEILDSKPKFWGKKLKFWENKVKIFSLYNQYFKIKIRNLKIKFEILRWKVKKNWIDKVKNLRSKAEILCYLSQGLKCGINEIKYPNFYRQKVKNF